MFGLQLFIQIFADFCKIKTHIQHYILIEILNNSVMYRKLLIKIKLKIYLKYKIFLAVGI